MSQELRVSSLSDLERIIKGHLPKERLWYRGQSKRKWDLAPSISRKPFDVSHEPFLLKRFKQDALRVLAKAPANEWEWLFLMQHHGVPTRLLDWSENPLVALYFAVESTEHDSSDGAIWVLTPRLLNKTSGVTYPYENDIPSFSEDAFLEPYLPSKSLSFGETRGPIAAIAPRSFLRISAQYGTFTVFQKDLTPLNKRTPCDYVLRITVPKRARKQLRSTLQTLGIDQFSIYPELANLAKVMREEMFS